MKTQMEESRFKELLGQSITGQWEKFEYYRNLCKKKGLSLEDIQKAIKNEEYYLVPGVISTAFKKSKGLFNDLNDFTMEGKFQVSSSTSGDPSYIYTSTQESGKIIENYRDTFGIEGVSKALGFAPSGRILSALSRKLSHMGHKSIARMKYALDAADQHYEDMTYTLDMDILRLLPSLIFKGQPAFKKVSLEKIIESIKDSEQKRGNIAIGGFVLLFVPYLDQMKEGQFSFDDNLHIVFSGGGYGGVKGSIKGKEINKPELVKRISSVFGLDHKHLSTNVKDIYGFTESPATNEGYWNDELGDFVFRTWHESRAYIVDPETEKPLKKGHGLLKFITPYSTGNPSSSNVSLLQCDMATIVKSQPDYRVTEFTYIKRLKTSSVEGCGYKADEIASH